MGGSIKPINPHLLKILPRIMRKIKKNNIKTSNKDNGRISMSGRVKMSGSVDKDDLNDIQSKLNALKSKYK